MREMLRTRATMMTGESASCGMRRRTTVVLEMWWAHAMCILRRATMCELCMSGMFAMSAAHVATVGGTARRFTTCFTTTGHLAARLARARFTT
jgi:hypothetical protein